MIPPTSSSVPAIPALPEGFRMTRQRQQVYNVLRNQRDHPTAADLFERTEDISLATIYNCLEALTTAGIVRQVSTDRSSARYCPNLHEHAHFHCSSCGGVTDVDPKPRACSTTPWSLPAGSAVETVDTVIHGTCPACQS